MYTPLAINFLLLAAQCTTNADDKSLISFIFYESEVDSLMY